MDHSTIQLVIDYRETALIDKLNQLKIQHIVENLTVGDIQIRHTTLENTLEQIIIERKTVTDYLHSIQTKRLNNQILRLKQVENAKIILLVEGNLQSSFGQPLPFRCDSTNHLYNSMLNRIFTDQIPVIRSDHLSETIIWIEKIRDKFSDIISPQTTKHKPTEYINTLIKSKKSHNLNPTNCYLLQLNQIPGVSINIAKTISQYYPNLFTLIHAYNNTTHPEKLLANLIIGQKKLGPVLSLRIFHFIGGAHPPPLTPSHHTLTSPSTS